MSAVQKTKATYKSVYIKCVDPVEASVFDMQAFIEYLTTKFKPFKGATAGNVGVTNPEFSAEKNKLAAGKTVVIGINKDMNTVKISTKSTVSKAYIKYLVKKFLKKNLLREHIRVVAPTKNSLNLRFFAMQADNSVEA